MLKLEILTWLHANNKGIGQPLHPHSLNNPFIIQSLEDNSLSTSVVCS